MMVSTATVVLPVLRSPMSSSRWPRPIGVMESMALMPGLQRLLDRLAVDHAGRLHFEAPAQVGDDGPLTVDGVTQGD